jgi:hypothetical protein
MGDEVLVFLNPFVLLVIDEEFVGMYVLRAVEEYAVRGAAVPSRASHFLIVAFDVLGQVVVNDKGKNL